MSKIDFSKPIQYLWVDERENPVMLDCLYIGKHPKTEGIHYILRGDNTVLCVVEETLRNKPVAITAKRLYDNLYQEAVQDGLGWATPSQIKDMLFEKLVAFGMIDQEAVYETK